MLQKTTRIIYCLLTVLFSMTINAHADEYPSGMVTLVAPYGQGGAADVHARIISATAPAYLGKPIFVVNKAGASGVLGSSFVVQAPKDGYTLLSARVGSQASVPALNSEIPYKWDDFTFIGLTERNPFVLAVSANSKYKSFADLKNALKSGKKVTYSTSGTGTLLHIAALVMADALKIDSKSLTHVPYKGGGKAKIAVTSGQVDMIWQNLSGVIDAVRQKELKVLAITTVERHPLLPDVPTVGELGHKELEVIIGWSGIFGPPNLPEQITAQWVGILSKLKKDRTFNKLIRGAGSIPDIRSPEDTKMFVKNQYRVFKRVTAQIRR